MGECVNTLIHSDCFYFCSFASLFTSYQFFMLCFLLAYIPDFKQVIKLFSLPLSLLLLLVFLNLLRHLAVAP